MGAKESEPSQDRVFDILSSPRRRYVLFQLKQRDDPIELTELAEELAAWENETTVAELSKQERKRVYVSLYQTHVPKLEEAGLVEYDSDAGLVSLSGDETALEPFIGGDDTGPRWYLYYAVAAVLGLALLGGVAVGLVGIGPIAASAVVVLSFLALALLHAVYVVRTESEGPRIEAP